MDNLCLLKESTLSGYKGTIIRWIFHRGRLEAVSNNVAFSVKLIFGKAAKSSAQKNDKRAEIHGTQSASSGNGGGVVGKNNIGQ